METNELLQAIRQIVQDEVSPIKQDITGIKSDVSELKQDVAGLKQDVSVLKEGQAALKQDVFGLKEVVAGLQKGQEFLREQITKTNIALEHDIGKKLSALFDGHQLDSEKIKNIEDTVEGIEASFEIYTMATNKNIREITKLKEKIG